MKLIFFIFLISTFLISESLSLNNGASRSSSIFGGEVNLGPWDTGFLQFAEAPGPGNDNGQGKVILAEERTERPDILRGFKKYHGGWDITNRHYWSSVGFTGAAGFILAALWFVAFGIVLVVYHCCGKRIKIRDLGSCHALRICLILLIVFTCASAIGCILLSVGQDEFHREVLNTLKYVVNQSDYTVETLRNITEYLSEAKIVNVEQIFLPPEVQNKIDKLNGDLDTAADVLTEKTNENSEKIRDVFKSVRSVLIVVATVMLLVTLLGLLLSIFGYRHAINIFIFSGWLLVAVTFILCGVFLILNNAISDTCVAMEEWVNNSHAETALSNILPCLDQGTTNRTLVQSKEIINTVVTVVNTAVYTSFNVYPSPQSPYFHNQSGPMMPPLCSPFDTELRDRQCGPQEVSLANASLVWQNYTCRTSPAGSCITAGRITPDIYSQLVSAVNVSYALYHYAPPLLNLTDCNFVRETFKTITSDYCPALEHDLQIVVAGLGLISVGVMLCLILWILYTDRPPKEKAFLKHSPSTKILDGNGKHSSSSNKLSPSGGDLV